MSSRRVVVTGASSGIGAATVRLFRERGWEVVGVARRQERLDQLAAETGAEVFAADLTRQEDVDALRDHLAATGPIHALVNNAGGAKGLDSVEASSVDDWVWMYEINVIGTKRVISALLPCCETARARPGTPTSSTSPRSRASTPTSAAAGTTRPSSRSTPSPRCCGWS